MIIDKYDFVGKLVITPGLYLGLIGDDVGLADLLAGCSALADSAAGRKFFSVSGCEVMAEKFRGGIVAGFCSRTNYQRFGYYLELNPKSGELIGPAFEIQKITGLARRADGSFSCW